MTNTIDTDRKVRFLAADRKVPTGIAAASIAASWVWAPALFVSAEVAYKWGWQGLAWFVIPNVLVLVIFGWFAERMRNRLPDGFTLSAYMRDVYSRRVQNAYIGQLSALAICSFAVQLVAGGAVIATITGLPYLLVTALMAGAAFAYSVIGGLKASIVADLVHIIATVATVVIFAPAIATAVGLDTILAGLSSAHVDPWTLALAFGIPTAIGLLSGPFGDQSFWQRAFAIRQGSVRRAFTLSAPIFAIVPLSMAVLGFAAVGGGLNISNPQLVNVETVQQMLPSWAIIPFTVMILGALVSTLDNNLCSVSALAGHDLAHTGNAIRRGRAAMIGAVILATLIANVPGIAIVHLFLVYGTLRASTLAPTVITLVSGRRPTEAGVFYGIIAAIFVGVPVLVYGSILGGGPTFTALGSVLTITIATVACLATRSARARA